MKVAFRVDAGVEIGGGHVMRCLALAEALQRNRLEAVFVCRERAGSLGDAITSRGYELRWLPAVNADARADPEAGPPHAAWLPGGWRADAAETIRALGAGPRWDWLVVDHYGIDRRWEEAVRPACGSLLVIDDLADRPHECVLLVDQNPRTGCARPYDALVGRECVQLLGPQFALLSQQFQRARHESAVRQGSIGSVLVFAGVADPQALTVVALRALQRLMPRPFDIVVVAGSTNPHLAEITALCESLPRTSLHVDTAVMARLMAQADLAVGAPGSATWERCAVGLPSLLVTLASNQESICRATAEAGAAVCLGRLADDTGQDICNEVERLQQQPMRLREMSAAAFSLVDGEGARRVAEAMVQRASAGQLSPALHGRSA